ncbi:hypothetical protein ACFFV7_29720 [Nonomuraea spiralis]|uniref:Uncharacterized protein n=1 Tax=Nonomuraea spiralis TaxID=46182 RepID=A0ABV5ILL3_9ACTN|nr:hypothetical protein [Nonomuraea spiralis]GGT25270.1 hypothetical protein GCM10010176_082250 [Nonomuraea spiralis]
MAQEYLSAAQVDRYGRFVAGPTPEELERFFFLDAAALEEARDKRRWGGRLRELRDPAATDEEE